MKDTLEEYLQKSEKLLEQMDSLHHDIIIADNMVVGELNKVNKGEYQIDIEMLWRAIRALDSIISNINRAKVYSIALSERNVEHVIKRTYDKDENGLMIK